MKFRHALVLAFVLFLGISHYSGYTPIAFGAFFLLASIVAYYLYMKDKAAAIAGSWRIPENTLHLTALLFGWPGALIAQGRLRHKTKKKSFQIVFWLTVSLNLGGVAWLHSPQGNNQLRESAYQLESLIISSVSHQATVATVLLLTKFRKREANWLH